VESRLPISDRVDDCLRDVRAELRDDLSGPLRDVLAAFKVVTRVGLRPTLAHSISLLMNRLHGQMFDRRLQAPIPHVETRRISLNGFRLLGWEREMRDALPCAPIPSKAFHWALRAFAIHPRKYHFVDIGAGWGYALLLAAAYPFRQVTGVEFAAELHAKATANLAWAKRAGRIKVPHIQVRCESALQTELPQGPLLLFLYHPFREPVMREFIERVEDTIRLHPRPVVILYANPAHRHLFAREGIVELKRRGLAGWLLSLFSPFGVRAYAFTRPPAARTG
jgi:hypothetical protein